jgi:hypothetical protein
MSSSTSPKESRTEAVFRSVQSRLRGPLEALAFWSAVFLPFCLLALLVGGLAGTMDSLLFVGLVIANVTAVVVGHDYRQ